MDFCLVNSKRSDELDFITDIFLCNVVKFTCIHKQQYELHCVTVLGICLQSLKKNTYGKCRIIIQYVILFKMLLLSSLHRNKTTKYKSLLRDLFCKVKPLLKISLVA